MPNTAQLKFKEIDLTTSVLPAPTGINAVMLETKRGEYFNPNKIYNNWETFERDFGGLVAGDLQLLALKKAFDKGSAFRICKVGHLVTGSVDAVKADPDTDIVMGTTELFKLTPKYEGAAYNDLVVSVEAASNGDANFFNLIVTFVDGDIDLTERYENILIEGTPTVLDSRYLDDVISGSSLVNVEYKDLSGETAPVRPVNVVVGFDSGTNGSSVVAADYVAAVDTFDNYDDFMLFGVLPKNSSPEDTTISVKVAAYADKREDCVGLMYIGDNSDSATIISDRDSTNVDSSYSVPVSGATNATDEVTGEQVVLPSMGDIFGNSGSSDALYGPWYSFAGPNRGRVFALGVPNNFGTKGKFAELNQLANRQIVTIINRDGKNMVWGNFTAQKKNSQTSFLSIRKLIIYMKKSLSPTLESFIEEPLDIPLFVEIANAVTPFLDDLTSPSKRALLAYSWEGDQFAKSTDDFKVNNPNDVGLGKYKVKLKIKPINSLQEFEVSIVLTPAGVSFSSVSV